MFKKITILLFNKNELTILKKKKNLYIYIYNYWYFFNVILNKKNNFFYDKYSKTVNLYLTKDIGVWSNIFFKYLNSLLFSWNNFFFKKLKFSGKGYKIKKSKKKNVKLFFNNSHLTIFIFKKKFFKKIRKNKFLLKSTTTNIDKYAHKIKNIRNINYYTGKGLRLARAVIIKKASKKGVSL